MTKQVQQEITPTHFLGTTGTVDGSTLGWSTPQNAKGLLGLGTSLTVTANNGGGSAGAPAFSFTGDSDTGMFNPGGNVLAWSTGGGEKMRVTSAGNVLIGATSTSGPNSLANTLAHLLNVQNTAIATPQAVIKGGISQPSGITDANSTGNAQVAHWVKAIPVAGTGARLVIPFISQSILSQTTIVKVLVRQDRFNITETNRNFEATFTVGHLTTLTNLASWGLGGNIANLTTSGMDVRLNVTNTLTSGAVLVVYLQVMSYQNDRSVDYANIRVE